MNTYTRNLNTENPGSGSDPVRGIRIGLTGFAARISLILLLIFFAIAGQMHLRAEIERLNKQASRIQVEINQLNVQCTHVRNRKESLTGWNHIREKIHRYRLGLRDADHRQVSTISLRPGAVRKTLLPVVQSGGRAAGKRQEYAHSGR